MNAASLAEIARQVLSPVEAPASFVHSQLLVARRAGVGRRRRVGHARRRHGAPPGRGRRPRGLALAGADAARGAAAAGHHASKRSCRERRAPSSTTRCARSGSRWRAAPRVRAALASATPASTAIARRRRRGAARHRACRFARAGTARSTSRARRWRSSFGADEIAGPMAPPKQRYKLAQLGGPPEDGGRPQPGVTSNR